MAKGRKTGGRTKGSRNKLTADARAIFGETWQRLCPDLEEWIRRTAEGEPVPMVKRDGEVYRPVLDAAGNEVMVRKDADPGKAAELAIKMAKFHVPELGRQELVGDGGGSITVKVIKYGEGK
jgi:hypothetical protein